MPMKWVEEPPEGRQVTRVNYDEIIGLLKSKPGKWLEVAESVSNNSMYVALKKRGAEVRMPSNGDKTYRIVASWPATEEAPEKKKRNRRK